MMPGKSAITRDTIDFLLNYDPVLKSISIVTWEFLVARYPVPS